VDWNAIAAQNMSGGNPLPHAREFSVLHVAMYDAVVSITGDYQPYRFAVRASPHASAEAAAITAAHDVLVWFHPTNVANFDTQYAKHLNAIRDGWAKTEGVLVGRRVAEAMAFCHTSGDEHRPPLPTRFCPSLPV